MDEAQTLQLVSKGGAANLQETLAKLKSDLPNALTLSVGKSGYEPQAITVWLQALIAIAPSSYVVFIDDATKKFIGSASTRQVLSILNDDSTSKRNSWTSSSTRARTPFAGMGFLVTQFLAPCDTNATALQKFAETPSADALVIVSTMARSASSTGTGLSRS